MTGRMTGTSRAPAWGPAEIANRCEVLGARVAETGGRFRVYPPNGGRPVFFDAGRDSRGSHLPNVLRDLREGGLDLIAEWEEEQRTKRAPSAPALSRPAVDQATADRLSAKLTMTATTTEEAAVAAPQNIRPTPAQVARIPYPRELAELREMIRNQAETAETERLELLGQLGEMERRVRALEDQLADGRPAAAGAPRRPATVTELVRAVVLAWFEDHRGLKITPQMLELNLDDLPANRGKTTVAGVCRDLVTDGLLQGGGPREGVSLLRGVYWMDPEPDQAEHLDEPQS